MLTAEQQYFELLRAALWGASVTIDGKVDWDTVMKIAKHHCNNVLLSDLALRMTDDNKPSQEMSASMQADMRTNLFNQMQLKKIMVSAVQLLREHNIEPVLLKGFGLAMLYPNPSLRQFGDIDLFVGLDDFHESYNLLCSLPGGYHWGLVKDVGRHYNIEFGKYPIEVHRLSADMTDPKEQALYGAIERDGLVEYRRLTDFDGFDLPVPSKEFMVFFTFLHAWHHFLTSGVGWRQLTDVAMALHAYADQLDKEKLSRWLNSMHLMKPWQTFGYLLVNYVGLPDTEMPLYDASLRCKAQRLYKLIMKEGNFKRKSSFKKKKPRHHFWRKVHSFIGVFVDFFRRAQVFPVAAFREMIASLRFAFGKMK